MRKFSDGLNHADSQTLDSLTSRLYALDKDRLADTEYRVGEKGALLMSRYKEKTRPYADYPPAGATNNRVSPETGMGVTPGVNMAPYPGMNTSSTMRLEDLDEGVSLSLALNSTMVPAALRMRHDEARDRLGFGGESGSPQYTGKIDREVSVGGVDVMNGKEEDTNTNSDRSMRLTDLTQSPVDRSSGATPHSAVGVGAIYDYQPGMATNTVSNRGGEAKARLFQSPALATNRAHTDKYGDGPAAAATRDCDPRRSYADPLEGKDVAPSAHTIAHRDAKQGRGGSRESPGPGAKAEFIDSISGKHKTKHKEGLGLIEREGLCQPRPRGEGRRRRHLIPSST